MLVTKNAADLCVLLVKELYGQLPSRVLSTLLDKGRSNVAFLASNTSMKQQQVRRGLAVLIQQNLALYHTDTETGVTHYEAEPNAAYNIVRIGKILDVIHRNHGEYAKTLVHNIILQGQMTVADAKETYISDHAKLEGGPHGKVSNEGNVSDFDNCGIENEAENLVAELIAYGVLEPVNDRMLQIEEDVRAEVEQDLMKNYPTGLRGTKQKAEFNAEVETTLRLMKEESKILKAELENDFLGSGAKRRKLVHGNMTNGFIPTNSANGNRVEPDTILRVNYSRCLVELRNHKLCQYVEEEIGYITAQVYGAMLAALTQKISSCRREGANGEDAFSYPSVTTFEIFQHLKPSTNVFAGIGRYDASQINVASAEKLQRHPPGYDDDQEQEGASPGDDDDDQDVTMGSSNGNNLNGMAGPKTQIISPSSPRDTKVKFAEAEHDPTPSEQRMQMRQHLLMLAESSLQFVRHSGDKHDGQWTVDFEPLIHKLKLQEIDSLVEESFGRKGLRLVKILRAKGKLDDKVLFPLALMKKADVHMKMAEMELAGYLDVQEVPRDATRTAARTIFLWFFDQERTSARILDNTYKAMARHIQRLEIERQKRKALLELVTRKDVQGMEEEKMRESSHREYQEFLKMEEKLLGQLDRLDDLVGVFRDY